MKNKTKKIKKTMTTKMIDEQIRLARCKLLEVTTKTFYPLPKVNKKKIK